MYYETAKQFGDNQGCNFRLSPTGARMLEDGLVDPRSLPCAECLSRTARDVEDRTGKEILTLKHMKLETCNISTK